jgi:hypothetical protein
MQRHNAMMNCTKTVQMNIRASVQLCKCASAQVCSCWFLQRRKKKIRGNISVLSRATSCEIQNPSLQNETCICTSLNNLWLVLNYLC